MDGAEVVAEAAVEAVDERWVLGTEPLVVDVEVGQSLETRLSWETGRAYRWVVRGGPPGLFVRPDGSLSYDLGEDAAGRWWVETRRRGTLRAVGFELRVSPAGHALTEDSPLLLPRRSSIGLPAGACSVGLGATTGLVHLTGSAWTHLGVDETTAGASPTALGRCGVGGTLSVVTGVEVSPWLSLGGVAVAGEMQLGVDWTRSTVTTGAFASWGPLGPGLGLRAGWRLGVAGGPELRVGWQAPVGGRATVAWVKRFGWRRS